jgi:hypothetical protein
MIFDHGRALFDRQCHLSLVAALRDRIDADNHLARRLLTTVRRVRAVPDLALERLSPASVVMTRTPPHSRRRRRESPTLERSEAIAHAQSVADRVDPDGAD